MHARQQRRHHMLPSLQQPCYWWGAAAAADPVKEMLGRVVPTADLYTANLHYHPLGSRAAVSTSPAHARCASFNLLL